MKIVINNPKGVLRFIDYNPKAFVLLMKLAIAQILPEYDGQKWVNIDKLNVYGRGQAKYLAKIGQIELIEQDGINFARVISPKLFVFSDE